MSEPVRPLEALIVEKIAEWRENTRRSHANANNQAISQLDRWQCYGVGQAYEQCADELAALLQDAAPPAPTAEQDVIGYSVEPDKDGAGDWHVLTLRNGQRRQILTQHPIVIVDPEVH